MKYLKPITGKTLKKRKFKNRDDVKKYLKSEIKRQGENVVIRDLDLTGVKDLNSLFLNIAESVVSMDLSGWKTSDVESMISTFYGCENLKSLNVTGWDTSNVEDMSRMFHYCPAPYKVHDGKLIKK